MLLNMQVMADFDDDFDDFGDFEGAPTTAAVESRISDQDFEDLLNTALSPPQSPQPQPAPSQSSILIEEEKQTSNMNQPPEPTETHSLEKVSSVDDFEDFGDFETSTDIAEPEPAIERIELRDELILTEDTLGQMQHPPISTPPFFDVSNKLPDGAIVEDDFPISRKDISIYPSQEQAIHPPAAEASNISSPMAESSVMVSPIENPVFSSDIQPDHANPNVLMLSGEILDNATEGRDVSVSRTMAEKVETASVSSSSHSTISSVPRTRYVDSHAHEADDEMSGFETSSTDQDMTSIIPSRKILSDSMETNEPSDNILGNILSTNDSTEMNFNSTPTIDIPVSSTFSSTAPDLVSVPSNNIYPSTSAEKLPTSETTTTGPTEDDEWQVEFTSFDEYADGDSLKETTTVEPEAVVQVQETLPSAPNASATLENSDATGQVEGIVSPPLYKSTELMRSDSEKSTLSDRRSTHLSGGFPGSDSDQDTRSLRSISDLSSSLEYQQGELVDLSEAHVAVYHVVDGNGTDADDTDFGDFVGEDSDGLESSNIVTIVNRYDEDEHDIHISEDMIVMAHQHQIIPQFSIGESVESKSVPPSSNQFITTKQDFSDPSTLHPPLVFPTFSANSPRATLVTDNITTPNVMETPQKQESPRPLTVQEILPENDDDFADFGDFEAADESIPLQEQTESTPVSASSAETVVHDSLQSPATANDDPKSSKSNDNKSSGNTTSATPLPYESEAATTATDDSEFACFDSFQEASSDATSIQSELPQHPPHTNTAPTAMATATATSNTDGNQSATESVPVIATIAKGTNGTELASAAPKQKQNVTPQPVNPQLLSEATPVIEASVQALLQQHRVSAASRILDYTPSLDDVLGRSKYFRATYVKYVTQPQGPETASSLPTEPVLPIVQRDYAEAPSMLTAWFSLLKIENEQEIALTESQRRHSMARSLHPESDYQETKLRSKSVPVKPDDASASSSASDASAPSDLKTRSESSSTPSRVLTPETKGLRSPPVNPVAQAAPSADLFDALDASLSLKASLSSPPPATKHSSATAAAAVVQELDPLDFFFQSSSAVQPTNTTQGTPASLNPPPIRTNPITQGFQASTSGSLAGQGLKLAPSSASQAKTAELQSRLRAWELSLPDYSFLLCDRIEMAPSSLL